MDPDLQYATAINTIQEQHRTKMMDYHARVVCSLVLESSCCGVLFTGAVEWWRG